MKKERNSFGIVKGLPKHVYIKGCLEAAAIVGLIGAAYTYFYMLVGTLVMLLEV